MAGSPAAALTRDDAGRACFAIALMAGIALRAWQWLDGTPLWLDELALTNGVLAGAFGNLFDGPSDFAQVAPPGFLAIEWVLAQVAPQSDLVLRAPAFAISCATIAATWFAARELVGERQAWLAAALVAVAGPLIFMGSQIKPYAADALFGAALPAAALWHDRVRTSRSRWTLMLTGVTAPLLSFGSIFVLAGAGVFLLFPRPWDTRAFSARIPVFLAWAASGLVALWMSSRLVNPATDALMASYWRDWFPPFPPASLHEATWPIRQLLGFSWALLGLRGIQFWGFVLLAGLVLVWRRRASLAALFLVPVLAALAAAALREFPFGQRLVHWLVPLIAILLTVVTTWVSSRIPARIPARHALPALAVLVTPVLSLWKTPPVYLRDDVRPVVAHLVTHAEPTDAIWVYWGAWHTWQRYFEDAGFSSGSVVHAACPRDFPRGHFRDFDRFRGQPRVWFLFSRLETEAVRHVLLGYLDAIGVRRDSLWSVGHQTAETPKVSLWLYDFTDTARSRAVSADAFPVPSGMVARRDGCADIDAMFVRGDGTRVVPLD